MPSKRKRPAVRPRKSPQQERSRFTVDAILEAAAYILVRRGYEGLTTNRIAERAGVNVASLYQYFPNKEAVLAELMRRHAVETRRTALSILEARRGRGFASTVRGVVAAIVAAHAVEPELHRIFTVEGARLGIPGIDGTDPAGLGAELGRWIDPERRPDGELALWIAWTAAHAVIHASVVERPEDASGEALIDEVTRLLVRFLRG